MKPILSSIKRVIRLLTHAGIRLLLKMPLFGKGYECEAEAGKKEDH